jgi:DNA-directed RNA polymerase specialized sigma24 family protein
MNDPEIAAALRASEPNALAGLFDTYADRLFRFCWFLLRNRDIAHIALRDTLVVAAAHIDLLPDPESLSSWLYALARAECRRRRPVPAAEADEPPARPSQPDADSRLLTWNAVTCMDPAAAEVLELACRHDVALGMVLGVSDPDARGLLGQARQDLARALGAEIVVSRASHACPDRAEVLRGWTGTMTGELRERVLRHAASCPVCGPNLPRNVSAARVFGLLPVISLPSATRAEVLAFATDPQTAAYREFAISRALPLPVAAPVRPRPMPHPAPETGAARKAARLPRGRVAVAVAAGAVAVAAATVVPLVVIGLPGGGRGPGRPAAAGPARPGGPEARREGAGAIGARPAGQAQPTSAPGPRPAPLPTASTGVTVFTTLTKPLPGTPTQRPAPLPPRVPGARVSGNPAPPPAPGQAQGTLTAAPSALNVGSASSGEVVLTAQGGPDTWSAGTSAGDISLSGYGGVLRAGQSVTIVVTVNRAGNSGGSGSIYLDQGTPAAQTVRVLWSGTWPRPPRPGPTPTPTTPAPSPSPSSSGTPSPSPSPAGSSGSSPPASPSSPSATPSPTRSPGPRYTPPPLPPPSAPASWGASGTPVTNRSPATRRPSLSGQCGHAVALQ